MKGIERPEIEQLKQFHLLDLISYRHLNYLRDKASIATYPPGETVFSENRNLDRAHYLLSGTIALTDGQGMNRSISAGDRETYCAIDDKLPENCSATATNTCRVLEISSQLVEQYFALSTTGEFKAVGIDHVHPSQDKTTAWVSPLLESPLTKNLSSEDATTLVSKFHERKVKPNTVLLRLGKLADYFFVLKSGNAKSTNREGVTTLLNEGEFFGDESLIPNAVSDIQVQMTTPGVVAALEKVDFNNLIKRTLIKHIDPHHVRIMEPHSFVILDVRLPAEYKMGHADNSINIPINSLKQHVHELDTKKLIFISEESGERGELAAHILHQAGFRTFLVGKPHSENDCFSNQKRATLE